MFVILPPGVHMQSVVRFAFGGEKLAILGDDLFKDRDVEGAPQVVTLVRCE
ncbi:MAG: hypothetical protein WDO18_04170 [Acidobacteriota bacterium]